MVTSGGKALWGGVKFVGRGFQSVGLQFKWASQWMTGGDNTKTEQMITEIGDKQWAVATQAYEMAKFLNDLAATPQSMQSKIAWAFYTGDKELLDTALHGSESHRQLFQMACEAITDTRKVWEGGTTKDARLQCGITCPKC